MRLVSMQNRTISLIDEKIFKNMIIVDTKQDLKKALEENQPIVQIDLSKMKPKEHYEMMDFLRSELRKERLNIKEKQYT